MWKEKKLSKEKIRSYRGVFSLAKELILIRRGYQKYIFRTGTDGWGN